MSRLLQQCLERGFVFVHLRIAETEVCLDQFAGAIENDFEFDRYFSQKPIGVVAIGIDVDSDHFESVCAVARTHRVEPWNGLPARFAPGGPEIDDYYTSVMAREIERGCAGWCSPGEWADQCAHG